MIVKMVPTYWFRIYISGPQAVAEQVIRKSCLDEGLCVTIEPTKFIYTGGEEAGVVIGLISYPRFPMELAALQARAESLAMILLDEMFQHSVLVMSPDLTKWFTKRDQT